MVNFGKIVLISFLVTLSLLTAGVSISQEPEEEATAIAKPNADTKLSLNFKDVTLEAVLEYLSETTGLVIVADDDLDQRLTVISRQPLTIDEAISLINSILKESGYAAVRMGRTLKVVSLGDAKTMNIPVTSGNDPEAIIPGDEIVTHVIPIRYAAATNLRENLASLIPEYASLEANEDANVLIITDTTANVRRLIEIVRALDTHLAAVAEIRVFHLRYAEAENTANLINEIFQQGQQGSSQAGQPRSPFEMMMRFRGSRADRQRSESEQAARPSVQVVAAADERTNSVVVSAPSDRLEVIEEMIHALDTQTAAVAEVKVFHLEYADAENTAELINEIFQEDSQASSRSQQSRDTFSRMVSFRAGRAGGQLEQSQQEAGPSVQVVAAADERTNSVVVSGPADTLEVIEGVIKQLDANPEQERSIFVYPLKNAQASNLKEVLNSLFTEMQALNEQAAGGSGQRFQGQRAGGGATGGAAGNGQSLDDFSDEAYFEADEDTNTLLIMTSSKNYAKVKKILDELDKPVPQVLIKVLLAEVTHSGSVDLGLEFSILNVRHDDDSSLFSTDFGLSSETGGLIMRTIEGDIEIALHALEEVGKLNILSRPYILTSNNQTATITVGEEVPFIRDTRITETGQTINTIEYEDIGIILEVTPSINPEGLVIMDVTPEISTTTAKTVPISETVNAAVFAKRSSQARVAIRDGQTIVIGGLIEDQSTEAIDKVPLAGDIPLLGGLFRRTVTEKQKTELLIFLTPYVATKDEELKAISDREKSQSKIVKTALVPGTFEGYLGDMENQLLSNEAEKDNGSTGSPSQAEPEQ